MRKLGLLLVLGNILLMAACGGGGGSTASTITSVSVSCNPSTVTSGGTSQCSASVSGTGSFSTAVSWSTSAGTIDQNGLLTAPVVTTSLLVTVTATSTQDTSKAGTASVTVNPETTAGNVQPIVVDSGPQPQTFLSANVAFTTITVCVPGTNTCQDIDHVQVDTGSSGLRLISGVLNINLPQANDSSGNPLDECLAFLDGFVWGPVATADILVAGEQAPSARVQVVIPSSSSPAVPDSCSGQTTGTNEGDSVMAFGANGLIGVGLFQQDCGPACTPGFQLQPVYYSCPPSGCTETSVNLPDQIQNPVTLFATDNNGVVIQLPSVPNGGLATVSGSLIFGIGTQSNNGLGSANVYEVPDNGSNPGDFITVFNGVNYPESFIDSGSNGLFFLNSSIAGVPPDCSDMNSWYCPNPSPDNLSAGNQGSNMSSPVTVNFSIENTDTLFNGNSNAAFSTLGGHNCDQGSQDCGFDWGLTFFYGRSVFSAIDGMNAPGGTAPYYAY